jgi:hypothetical protein
MTNPLRRLLTAAADTTRRPWPNTAVQSAEAWKWLWVAVETLVATMVALAFRQWIAPQDPFGLHAQFPWLWIVPTLLAMRYGTAAGVASVLLLILAWWAQQDFKATEHLLGEFPKEYFLGGLVLNLVAGQFSDVWTASTRKLRAVNAYLDERLNTLTKNHFLLRLSHERLEQDLLAKPVTLRETLLRLRELSRSGPDTTQLAGAAEFMQLLGQSCQLEIAAIYPMHCGTPAAQPAAVLGNASDLERDDPLVRYCLEQNALAHVQTGDAAVELRDASRYLICAPVIPSSGAAPALVAVERMPFFALNDDTLQLFSVLVGYYADGLLQHSVASEVLERVPQCPPEMAVDIVRLHRVRAEAGIDSALVALVFESDSNSRDMFEQVKRFKRAVDLVWELESADHHVLITLLPLAGPAAVEGYLLRINSALRGQFGAGFLDGHVATHTARIGLTSPADTLTDLLSRCGF